MNVGRRTLVKGIAAAGALLAVGPPRSVRAEPPAIAAPRCALLLGCSAVDAAFERGARAVFARARQPGLEIVRWNGGPLARPGLPEAWRRRSLATRWVVVVDDAGAAVFQEWLRSSGGQLLSRGSHVCSHDGSVPLRHSWMAASPAWSAGATLASHLIERGAGFRITESFLGTGAGEARPLARGAFQSPTDDWAECVAQAVAASVLGLGASPDSAERTFTQRGEGRGERGPTRSFVSFVVDV